jgi:glucosamine-6-phosphate deaminase
LNVTIRVFADEGMLAAEAAGLVAAEVMRKPALVMGLPTGRTPVALYRHLVALAQERGLDFARVRTFNLDEFVGLRADDPRSYQVLHEGTSLHTRRDPDRAHGVSRRRRP